MPNTSAPRLRSKNKDDVETMTHSDQPAERRRELQVALEEILLSLRDKSPGVLCRSPLVDHEYPQSSDIDLIAVGNISRLCPERRFVERGQLATSIPVDVLWVPKTLITQPAEHANEGMMAHMVAESMVVWDKDERMTHAYEMICRLRFQPKIWKRRIESLLTFGDRILAEAKKNLDFPPAVLFFLQMCYASYAAALGDALQKRLTNIFTKPMRKIRAMASEVGSWLEESFVQDLRLEVDPEPLFPAMKRIFDHIEARLPSPPKKGSIGEETIREYAYTLSRRELNYRLAVAKEMAEKEDSQNAVFYLRYWGYALSRCPAIHQAASEGKDLPFLRPGEPALRSLEPMCHELIEDFSFLLSGLDKNQVGDAIQATDDFRERIRARLVLILASLHS